MENNRMEIMFWWDKMSYSNKIGLCESYGRLIHYEMYPEFLTWVDIKTLYNNNMEYYLRIRKLKEFTKKCRVLLPKIKKVREEMNDNWHWISDYEYRGMTYLDGYKRNIKSHDKLMKSHNKLLEKFSLLNQERRSYRILIRNKQLDLFL